MEGGGKLMTSTAKALIITWMVIGFLVVGAVGFYLGRVTVPKNQTFSTGQPLNQQQPNGNQPAGSFQQQSGGVAPQQPQGNSQQQDDFQQQGDSQQQQKPSEN